MFRFLLRLVIIAGVLYLTYQVGYKNGKNDTEATFKNVIENSKETTTEIVDTLSKVYHNTINAAKK